VRAAGASVPCQSRSGVRFEAAASATGAAPAFSLVDRPLRMVRPNFRSVDSAPFFLALALWHDVTGIVHRRISRTETAARV